MLHLRDQPRQRGLRRGGGQDQQELPAQVAQQGEDAHPRAHPQQGAQHQEDEEQAGRVEADHDDGEGLQCVDAGRADHRGDRSESAHGRRPHDHREHPEHQLLHVSDAPQHRLARCAHGLECEPAQQCHQQRLEHLAAGEGGDQCGRDDPEQELRRALGPARLGLRLTGAARRLGQLQPAAGLQEVADQQADGQRHRGHDHEVAEGESAHGADLGGLAHRADAQHDRAEDHGRDHHLDEVHEARAQRFELHGHAGCGEADHDAEQHRGDHRDVEIVRSVALGGHDASWW